MRGGVKVLKFWIVCPLKTLLFGRSKHLKKSSKILANTFSDSLAILSWRRQIFLNGKIPGSLPVPITVSELWEWLFPFPSHNSLRERTPLASSTLSCLFQQKERDKAEVSTSRGGTGARCVRPWLTRGIVSTRSFRRGWARCRSDRKLCT